MAANEYENRLVSIQLVPPPSYLRAVSKWWGKYDIHVFIEPHLVRRLASPQAANNNSFGHLKLADVPAEWPEDDVDYGRTSRQYPDRSNYQFLNTELSNAKKANLNRCEP